MEVAASVFDKAMALSPTEICQLFYVLSAAAVLAVAAVPETTQRLLTQYGARSCRDTATASPKSSKDRVVSDREPEDDANAGVFYRLIRGFTSVGQIPHSWFIHFYILSLGCTIFWATQLATNGAVLQLIVQHQLAKGALPSMTMSQVFLAWLLMGLQGARRLYECLAILRPSSSSMWIIHWLLGNGFYLCTSVAVWIEGSSDVVMQYRCHRYLAGLKKYSLPDEGMFRYLVSPHYTCECLIYLSMAVLAAPEGLLYNRTLILACLFISVNLGVTANGTKLWYSEKFGDGVRGKWKMIPLLF
ncbi:3-oxo-5-alpha-steroid 4-dehydrogenase [Astrocystis sublimbata]|nr:3-oxo-5-alpha-steroid 4-dehydrogenase [Astrocystis sublimbata]